MSQLDLKKLSRREKEIMDIIFAGGEMSVVDVMQRLSGKPGNSTVRKQMNILEEKGYLQHRTEKNVNFYSPTIKPGEARKEAMSNLMSTMFDGSLSQAFVSLMDVFDQDLTSGEKQMMEELIRKSREEGR